MCDFCRNIQLISEIAETKICSETLAFDDWTGRGYRIVYPTTLAKRVKCCPYCGRELEQNEDFEYRGYLVKAGWHSYTVKTLAGEMVFHADCDRSPLIDGIKSAIDNYISREVRRESGEVQRE